MRLSQYEKAIGYHEQAVAIFREVKDRNGEGSKLANIGLFKVSGRIGLSPRFR